MKNLSILTCLLFSLCLPSWSYAQSCTVGTLILSQTSDVDQFLQDHPNCTEIIGSVRIASSLSDWTGLNQITRISGDLEITWGDDLGAVGGLTALAEIGGDLKLLNSRGFSLFTALDNLQTIGRDLIIDASSGISNSSFDALNQLQSIGRDFHFSNNQTIHTLAGFSELQSVGEDFLITRNNGLVSLTAFSKLKVVGRDMLVSNNGDLQSSLSWVQLEEIGRNLSIRENIQLTSLQGLETLHRLGGAFLVSRNDALVTLTDFSQLDSINGNLVIGNNAILPNLAGLEQLTFVAGNLSVTNNHQMESIQNLANLSQVLGNLGISSNTILPSLNGLEGITSIGGSLALSDNAALVNIQALSNLTSIGAGISITNHQSLESLVGLQNVTSLGEGVVMFQNWEITSYTGFPRVTEIPGELTFIQNSKVTSLTGLEELRRVTGNVNISFHLFLQSLVELDNLTQIEGSLSILGNRKLAACSADVVCNHLSQGRVLEVSDNDIGCSSEEEISAQCEERALAKVNFQFFYDADQNQIWDADEVRHPDAGVLLQPEDLLYIQGSEQGGTFRLDTGSYTLHYEQSLTPAWALTTSPDTFYLEIDNDSSCINIVYGLHPTLEIPEMTAWLNRPPLRCNTTVQLDFFARNSGTTLTDGTLWVQIDTHFTNFIPQLAPDTMASDYLLGWHFERLFPGQRLERSIVLTVPGPPEIPLGDWIEFLTYVEYEDINGSYRSPDYLRGNLFRCSYDPNDKQVNPQRAGDYTLFDEELIYTIRFQNTGNDVAYDVVIRDTLDDLLEPTTFRLLSTSHPDFLQSSLLADRYLSFEFKNIFLPDSTSDLEGSQGYITYRIEGREGLAEESEIHNTASIYFDQNPPIVTNTTRNLMVSELLFDDDLDGYFTDVDCDDTNPNIHPDAMEQVYDGLDNDCDPLTLDDDLDQDGFPLAEDCNDEDAMIFPGAIEIPDNGIDEDCDGGDLVTSLIEVAGGWINLFPNPVVDQLSLSSNISLPSLIQVRNATGQVLTEQRLNEELHLDFSTYPAGIYLLTIQVADTIKVVKVLKP